MFLVHVQFMEFKTVNLTKNKIAEALSKIKIRTKKGAI